MPLSAAFKRVVPLALGLLAAVPSAYAQTPAATPPNELDAFTKRVLARRELTRTVLNDYILDKRERFAIRGPGRVPLHRTMTKMFAGHGNAASPQGGGTGAPAEPPKPEAAPQAQTQADPINWPVSLERIQEAISRPAAITTAGGRPVFRVEIFAKKPTIEDILGPDYLIGPTPYGGMTHQEFLTMVTPVEYRGMGAFTVGEALTVAAMAIGLQWAITKVGDKLLMKIDKLKKARTARAKEAARREVLAAMDELAAARKNAGLPSR